MTRSLAAGLCLLGIGAAVAQTGTPPPPAAPAESDGWGAEAAQKVPQVYQAWKSERDPAKRSADAGDLIDSVVKSDDVQLIPLTDEVARGGAPLREITTRATARGIALNPLVTLKGARASGYGYSPSPVFRRISGRKIEAWTAMEGWLFNAKGEVRTDIHVPRRDGLGREWFGAFLPNGNWITTDIGDDDRQLNGYSPSGKWKWKLAGSAIISRLPKPNPYGIDGGDALIGWARADKTGRKWLVSVGANGDAGFALIDQNGRIQPLPYDAKLWQLVHARAMGIRGGYVAFKIDSDDASESLSFETVAHGPFCTWPVYALSGRWRMILNGGGQDFGFWPKSHRTYVDVSARVPEPQHRPRETWFLDAGGKYEGQIAGTVFADAANGRDLLMKDGDNRLLQITHDKDGPAISGVRTFSWPDGAQAEPLAIFDDLKLGFFLRAPKATDPAPQLSQGQRPGDVILAGW